MHQKYAIIGKVLSQEAFMQAMSEVKSFKNSAGDDLHVNKVERQVMEITGFNDKSFSIQFLHLGKLYKLYRNIADLNQGIVPERKVLVQQPLGLELLKHENLIGYSNIRYI